MSLGQEVQICALVCDEQALFEYETLQSGHELSETHRLSTAANRHSFQRGDRQKVAGQRPILCSGPAVPLETAEFNRAALPDAPQ